MTQVHSNGSKWMGEALDTIEDLCKVLEVHTLNPLFEDYGNFASMETEGVTHFFGNFFDVSHVFRIDTDDAPTVERLTALIRANQQTPAYAAAKRDREQQKIDEARRWQQRAEEAQKRRARGW